MWIIRETRCLLILVVLCLITSCESFPLFISSLFLCFVFFFFSFFFFFLVSPCVFLHSGFIYTDFSYLSKKLKKKNSSINS